MFQKTLLGPRKPLRNLIINNIKKGKKKKDGLETLILGNISENLTKEGE